jgi:hypothetical protein
MLQNNPIFEYKKFYLKTIIISGAPAIDNLDTVNDTKNTHYITINDRSYYTPVIRVLSNEKMGYCSFKK